MIIKRKIYSLATLGIIMMTLLMSCGKSAVINEYTIIPEPVYLVQKGRTFTISTRTKVCFVNLPQNSPIAKYISQSLRKKHIRPAFSGVPQKNCITFAINDTTNPAIGNEGYLLQVRPEGISISANTEAGLFYAFRTFVQMLPTDIQKHTYRRATIPECTILDYPRYAWRGCQLDCCRHFFSVKNIKRHLDVMAALKLNKFHWVLADDQGWRIEIEQYPQLNDIGSWHVDRSNQPWGFETPAQPDEEPTYGGYYTKRDIAEIIEYANERNIEIIPEIDLTGHCSPILAAYPELSCDGGPYAVSIGPCYPNKALLCAGNALTIEFLTKVLDEIAEIFPSEYVHIGLSGNVKDNWERCPRCQAKINSLGLTDETQLEGWLVSQIEAILQRKGKRLIGRDDLLSLTSVSDDALCLVTQGDNNLQNALINGRTAIYASPDYCFLDSYQADSSHQATAEPQYLPLRKVYQFDPMTNGLTKQEQSNLWGAEAVIWTNYATTYSQVEYQLLPRLCALAECLWTPSDKKDWTRFQHKIESHKKRMSYQGYNYCKGDFKPNITTTPDNSGIIVELSTEVNNTYIYYTTDGTDPTPESAVYQTPLHLPHGTLLRTLTYYNGEPQEGIYNFPL